MTHDGTLQVRLALIRKAMRNEKLTAWKLAKVTDQCYNTVRRLLANGRAREATLFPVLERLKLNYDEVVIRACRSDASQEDNQPAAHHHIHEWEVVDVVSKWQTAANGLQYKVCKLKHLHRDNKLARGKQYDLTIPATRDKERLRTLLNRHPDVCDEFRGHPQIPINLATTPADGEDLWWVIDEWVEGPTLEKAIREGLVKPAQLPQIMREIAVGLQALHGEGIILRELQPASVLLRVPTGTVVLTDFELAKLSDGKPTVSRDRWPQNPYRAEEVGAPNIDTTVDLYSWGRILVHAACGWPLPRRGTERQVLARAKVPKQVLEIAVACTSPACTNRPRSIEEVIRAIHKWQ